MFQATQAPKQNNKIDRERQKECKTKNNKRY